MASITTASAAFVLSGLIALVLATLSSEVRLELGGIAAASGALALGLLRLDRRPRRDQPDPEPGRADHGAPAWGEAGPAGGDIAGRRPQG